MKVLLINDYLEKFGGAEIYTYNLKKLLEENGLRVKILGGEEKKDSFGSFFSRWYSFRYYQTTKEVIKEFKPNIIHIQSVSRNISPSPILAAKKYKIPVVMTIHDFHYVCPKTWMTYAYGSPCQYGFSWRCLFHNCYYQKKGLINFPYHLLKWLKVRFHRKILKKYVNYFICPSRILVWWMKKSLKINNISYIPNFTDIKINKNQKIKKKNNQLLFVGRLSKEKGVDILITAIKIVKKRYPNILVKIIGDGSEKNDLENLTNKLNLKGNIKFLGKIQHDKLCYNLQESLAMVIPSIWMENAPLSALEAINFKIPIIVSDIGGLPELIFNGKTGVKFKTCSPKDLAEKIVYIISTRKTKYSTASVPYELSEDNHYKQIINLYHQCTSVY